MSLLCFAGYPLLERNVDFFCIVLMDFVNFVSFHRLFFLLLSWCQQCIFGWLEFKFLTGEWQGKVFT